MHLKPRSKRHRNALSYVIVKDSEEQCNRHRSELQQPIPTVVQLPTENNLEELTRLFVNFENPSGQSSTPWTQT